MQQKVEAPRNFLVDSADTPQSHSQPELEEYDDGLWATGGPIIMASIGAMLVIAMMTFLPSGEALFAVVISVAYTILFFGIPALMMRTRAAHNERWRLDTPRRRDHVVVTYTGTLRRGEAVLQMVMVPVGLVFLFGAFALIWTLARPW